MVIVIIIVAIVAVVLAAVLLQKKKVTDLNVEVIDRELTFDEVMSFFKVQKLKEGDDIPFIANGDSKEFRKMLHIPYPQEDTSYVSLFIGVFNEKQDKIVNYKFIKASSLDKQILEVLGNEKLIVLN